MNILSYQSAQTLRLNIELPVTLHLPRIVCCGVMVELLGGKESSAECHGASRSFLANHMFTLLARLLN